MDAALSREGVSVSFGSVKARRNVSISFEPERVHALLGQNGAGETTLARFISGLASANVGRLEIFDREIDPGDVAGVRERGLDIVHRRFTLPPTLASPTRWSCAQQARRPRDFLGEGRREVMGRGTAQGGNRRVSSREIRFSADRDRSIYGDPAGAVG